MLCERDMRRLLVSILVGALVAPALLNAAQGDVLRRIDLKPTCRNKPLGLAFDGKTLYYTHPIDAVGLLYRVSATTGADEGVLAVTKGGNPLPTGLVGLEYDANRGVVWAGAGNYAYAVSVTSGETTMEVFTVDMNGIRALAYDPFEDVVWVADASEAHGWYASGEPKGPRNFGLRGLSFDGTDMWQNEVGPLLPPAPQVSGVIYPSDLQEKIDLTRLIDPVGFNYNDIAYDCQTFPVPVVWVANNLACELIAYEVAARGPCLRAPTKRLVRATLQDVMARSAKLPVATSGSDKVWRIEGLANVDDNVDRIVVNTMLPLAFYRLLGPSDADLGNVLRAVKDAARDGVSIVE